MRRLARWSLAVCLLLAALVGGSMLIGNRQPAPDRLAFLRLNKCHLPCWIGITPGKTKFSEAKQALQLIFDDAQFTDLDDRVTQTTIMIDSVRGVHIIATGASPRRIGSNDPPVETVLLYYQADPDPEFTVGAVINLLGPPTSVTVVAGAGGQASNVYFDNGHLILDTVGEVGYRPCIPLAANMPLRGIALYEKMVKPASALVWRGFTSCYPIQ